MGELIKDATVPAPAANADPYLRRSKPGKLAKIGLAAGAMAAAIMAVGAKPNRSLAQPVSPPDISYQPKEVGVVTDMAEQPTLEQASAAVAFIERAGFRALKETVQIATGQQGFKAMNIGDQTKINNSLDAAQAAGLPVTLYLEAQTWIKGYQPPVRPNQQRGFCKVGAQIIAAHPGAIEAEAIELEPNNPHFIKRQFNEDGSDAAAKFDESLTATCYDIIKQQDPSVKIIGLELASGGNDDPNSKRPSHSPLSFVRDFCQDYKNSGRDKPIMDEASFHWYPPRHTNTQSVNGVSDYDKVVSALNCFEGTPQPLPLEVSWGEGGRADQVPQPMLNLYGGKQPPGSLPVTTIDQGNYVADSIKMAICDQPDTVSIFNFQLADDGRGIDTGLFWPSKKTGGRTSASASLSFQAKPSYKIVRPVITAYDSGTLCDS